MGNNKQRLDQLEKRHPRRRHKVFVRWGDEPLVDTPAGPLTPEQLEARYPDALVVHVRRYSPDNDPTVQNDVAGWDDAPDESPDDPNWIDAP